MKPTIKFVIKDSPDNNNIKSVQVHRAYTEQDGNILWGYVDSLHPMSTMELLELKNTLQEYIQNNDWY